MKKIGKWVPLFSERFPEDNIIVQLTYHSNLYPENKRCDIFAYYEDGSWYQAMDSKEIRCQIFAWRTNDDVYNPDFTGNGWIPAVQVPPEKEHVQITFAGFLPPHKPSGHAFAYYDDGDWYWADDGSKVRVNVLAWKMNNDVYDAEATLRKKYQDAVKTNMDELSFNLNLLGEGFDVDSVRRFLGNEKADHMDECFLKHNLLDKCSFLCLSNQLTQYLQKNKKYEIRWLTDDELVCKKKEQADTIANLFKNMSINATHVRLEYDGWHVF